VVLKRLDLVVRLRVAAITWETDVLDVKDAALKVLLMDHAFLR